MKLPSLNNENRLTLRCKLFGCRNEEAPVTYYDEGERHGVKDLGKYSATKTVSKITWRGCWWCGNFKKMIGESKDTWPKWL